VSGFEFEVLFLGRRSTTQRTTGGGPIGPPNPSSGQCGEPHPLQEGPSLQQCVNCIFYLGLALEDGRAGHAAQAGGAPVDGAAHSWSGEALWCGTAHIQCAGSQALQHHIGLCYDSVITLTQL